MKKFLYKSLTTFLSLVIALSLVSTRGIMIDAAEDELVNVALGGSISATHQNNSYPASKAIDGIINTSSYWDSGAVDIDNGEKAYLTLDLQKEYDLEKIVLFTYPGNLWAQTTPRQYRYTVEISVDNQTWQTVGVKTEGNSTEMGDTYNLSPVKLARYVRVQFDGSNCIQNNTDNEQIMHLLELQTWAKVEKEPEGALENIAKAEDFTLVGTSSGYSESSICDGNLNTLWATGSWDTVPTFTYTVPRDNTKPIRKISLDFEGGQHAPDRIVDITLEVLYKGEMEKEIIETKQAFSFLDQYNYEFEGTTEIDQIYVTLSNPKLHSGNQVLFTPAFAEVGIYVDKEGTAPNMSKFVNVAPNATVMPFEGANPETDSARLVDKDYGTLFTFHRGAFSALENKEVSVTLDLGKEDYDVNAFEIAFEKSKSLTDTFTYTYSIYTQKVGDEDWTKQVDHAKATRLAGDNIKTHFVAENDETIKVNKVKIVLDDMTATGWPSMAEFKIFAVEKLNIDGNIAFNKPTHTNTNQANSANITDGKPSSNWTGIYYPGYVDIDLEKNYNLDGLKVYLPTTGYSQYDIYTSMNGENFTKIYSKIDTNSTPVDGDVIDLSSIENREARIVRVYVNYQSGTSTNVSINEVKIYGEESGTEIQKSAPVEVVDFDDTEYAATITNDMVIEEVKGIITRQIGAEYVNWFSFDLNDNPNGTGYDYFDLSEKDGKIHIVGNNGVSLATGLNHYLKYYLNVNISQVGNQVSMPNEIVSLKGKTVYKETKMPVRYAYNYCTHSYSMPFCGEKEWRDELDWLALNGVNLVLDMTGQEEVWRRFLEEIGYSQDEAKDFIAGPAYYAWAYMANLSNYGGPVHNTWFGERVDLARKNQFAMRKLGMKPIMQGYSGMVPTDIEAKDSDTKGSVIAQGIWNGFQRPSMLKTTDPIYNEYAKLYYKIQKDVFGDVTNYYATDPFHEGGITGGMNPKDISEIVLDEMIDFDSDAVWVIQSWQANPTPALLQGIGDRKEHALILDLWAEKDPRWDGNSVYGYNFPEEFGNTPWVWCLLNNFGGRPGLKGYMDVLINDFPAAYNSTEHMAGIGITPEASYNNPVIYDLFFELIWVDDATKPLEKIDKDIWINDYITRRYGAASDSAKQAWDILMETVYNSQINNNGEGPVCSVVNARPGLDINNVSCCDSTLIKYDKVKLEEAVALLLEDYDLFSGSEGYRYDLASVLLQVLANTAQEYQKKMSSAYRADDLESFEKYATIFMEIIDETDLIASTQETTMVGTWIEQAKALAKNADEFSKELYEFNARSLITTWGSKYQANSLHDYSNRQWSGLTTDLYKKRWQLWIDERVKELKGEEATTIDWFEVEWQWANSNNEYSTVPAVLDMKAETQNILTKYSMINIPKSPAEDNSRDLKIDNWEVTAGSEQSQTGSEGPATNLIDNNASTIWHSVWSGTDMSNIWVNIHMPKAALVDGLRYQPRSNGGNGTITGYIIEVSLNNGETYHEVTSGTWAGNSEWKIATFIQEEITDIRLKVTSAKSDSSSKNFGSGAEIRLTGPVDKNQLENLINKANNIDLSLYTKETADILTEALIQAQNIVNNEDALQAEVDKVIQALTNAIDGLEIKTDSTVSKAALQIAVEMAGNVTEEQLDKVVPAVVTEFNAALEEARAILVNDNATQEEVDASFARLSVAMHMLEFLKGDKAELQDLVDSTAELVEGNYTEESWTALQEALTNANTVLNNENAMQEEVDGAYDNLQAAINGLEEVEVVDKSLLEAMVNKVLGLEEDKYIASSWQAMLPELEAAQEVLGNEKATQAEVDEACDALTRAYLNLRLKPNKDLLADLINKANGLNSASYTANTWAVVENEVIKAQAVLEDPEASEAEVKAAEKALTKALEGLELVKAGDSEVKESVKTGDTINFIYSFAGLVITSAVLVINKKRKEF
ncbi:alpha-N-acetylglucosaminidase TIM-barrel domain-containing protein [Thomasclavelia cocleata]|nr:alpha-N-acetylglucosaminidase TIM-barrel domain-containing protein [Thomasclavelia cocleata]MCR1960701.1 alpha-N-acetylglucosaminidase C-terminal domain-containing protein [Thomasclavelia cocleata]